MTDDLPLFTAPTSDSYGDIGELRVERWTQMKRQMLRLFGDLRGRIPDEAAYELGVDILAARPRASELHTEGLLRFSGQRRKARHGTGKELVITERGLLVLQLLRAKSDAAA